MITIILRLIDETQIINVYNVYNLSPTSYNDEINIISFIALNDALTMLGHYIIIKDFNLYYL
jgi:hypothetical protein